MFLIIENIKDMLRDTTSLLLQVRAMSVVSMVNVAYLIMPGYAH
jgi:hypothetical protein